MANDIAILSKDFVDLQDQITALSTNITSVVGPINTAFSTISKSITTTFNEMSGSSISFMAQLSILQGVNDFVIIGLLAELNDTLLQTKGLLNNMWDTSQMTTFTDVLGGIQSAVGTTADAVVILKDGQKALGVIMDSNLLAFIAEKAQLAFSTISHYAYEAAIGAVTAAKQLFNAETWISIGNWIKETAGTMADTIAKGAEEVALGALLVVQKLFNAETWISIGNWIKETAATIADTVAKGAQNVITGIVAGAQAALNFIMSLNPIALIVIAIAALVAGFILLWTKCDGFREFMIGFFKVIANGFIGFVNLLIDGINLLLKLILMPINLLIKALNIIPGVNIPQLSVAIPLIPTFAAGGLPMTGQMFVAREAGPELVGTIGNRSAVVNNDQIVESVSSGVARAVAGVLGGGSNQPIQVFIGNEQLDEYFVKGQRRRMLQTNGAYA